MDKKFRCGGVRTVNLWVNRSTVLHQWLRREWIDSTTLFYGQKGTLQETGKICAIAPPLATPKITPFQKTAQHLITSSDKHPNTRKSTQSRPRRLLALAPSVICLKCDVRRHGHLVLRGSSSAARRRRWRRTASRTPPGTSSPNARGSPPRRRSPPPAACRRGFTTPGRPVFRGCSLNFLAEKGWVWCSCRI